MAWTKGAGTEKGKASSAMVRNGLRAQEFARQIVESAEYRAALMTRAVAGSLPPGVEQLLFYYAYGKPVDNVQVELTTDPQSIASLTDEELANRADALAAAIRSARIQDGIMPPQLPERPADSLKDAIH